jgi:hypothetical protein
MKQSKYDTDKDGVCDAKECSDLVMINRNVTHWTDAEAVVVSSLAKIGIQVKPRELASSAAYTTIQTIKNKIPIALNAGWGRDYADACTFVGPLFDGRSIIATGNTNYPLVGLTADKAKELGVSIPAGSPFPASTPTSTPARRSQHPAGPAQRVLRQHRQEADGRGRPLGPVPVGQEHHGHGEHGHQVRVRPGLRLPVLHRHGGEQQEDRLLT